ncbi:MAG: AtpZ/AtpI family protein [Chloroflexi bacterium]|nr:AtpZ/AtpI family protein [Chloroflexota bacterium]
MDKWVVAARLLGIGWYIGISIAGGIFLGIWLDKKFDTSILFTLVGLFLGLGVAALGSYRMISPLLKEQSSKRKEDD